MSFLNVLSRTVSLTNLPFGYTLSVWSSGAIALDRFGPPSPVQALLFISGAILAYLVCAGLAYRGLGEVVAIRVRPIVAINVFSIVAAAAVSLVTYLFNNPILGYAVAGFTGTFTYILCMTTLMYVGERLSQQKMIRP